MPTTIIIPNWRAGGTLSQLAAKYGTTVQELQKANNITDPNKIKEGATLIIPDKTTAPGSLQGTLPNTPATPAGGMGGGSATPGATGATLPETSTDNLASFRTLLQTVSNRAKSEAQQSGVSVMNFDPSKVSGGTLSGILGIIDKQKTTGIADIYKSTTEFLDNQQKAAQTQIQSLISSGAIANLTDSALAKLTISGMDLDALIAIRKQKQDEASKPSDHWIGNLGGNQVRIDYDKDGNEIKRSVLGKAGKETGDSGNKFTELSADERGKVIEWMSSQPGFTPERLKQMDEDENFYNFIISQYYNR